MFGNQWTKRLQLVLLPLRNSNVRLRLSEKHEAFIIPKSYSSSANKNSIVAVQEEEPLSFTVCYLINSFEFSLKTAKSLSKKVHFENAERPYSVLQLLRSNGLTHAHLSKLVGSFPRVLLATEKNIFPKIEFFRSVGISGGDLADVVSSGNVLMRSLNKEIVPFYNFLKNYLKDDDKILYVLKCRTFLCGNSMLLARNVSHLQQLGVPKSSIMSLLTRRPSVLCSIAEKFDRNVQKVVGIGFDPSTSSFVYALATLFKISIESWEHKSDVYRRLGWSENEFLSAFRSYPACMTYSEENITGKMDFFVNKLGWTPATVAKAPSVLGCSMEKRIIPRCSVITTLLNEGLIVGRPALSTMFTISDKRFQERFVVAYQERVPQLLNIFQGKVKLFESGSKSE